MKKIFLPCKQQSVIVGLMALMLLMAVSPARAQTGNYEFNDAHFHLTNNIQEGPTIHDFLKMMGNKAGRAALFGVPLQQQWSYRVDGDRAPTYYLHSDAPLYYYSFTDAWIAMAYKSLTKEQQARLDPMITGFNPTDMYAVDHIRRVLQTFPGVFTGIGEFTIHKEFVSAKIPGEVASLQNPALDRIFDFAAEVGKRHPNTTIIWAHMGLGRLVAPASGYIAQVEAILRDPDFHNVYLDISWDEVAKYFVASPEATRGLADLIERYPDRFLFGSDAAAPADQSRYLKVFYQYEPLWKALDAETSRKVRLRNCERIFDEARGKVRNWENAHVSGVSSNLNTHRKQPTGRASSEMLQSLSGVTR